MQHNFIGSIHAEPPISPYEQWYNEKPDLNKYPMLPFGAIVMAHIPLSKQAVGVPRSELTYFVGPSLLHKKGLKLYNPTTKREIIRGTFKTIGPVRPIIERATYSIDEDDNVTEIPIVTPEPSSDVNDYKFFNKFASYTFR
jgi:hypothetical protein